MGDGRLAPARLSGTTIGQSNSRGAAKLLAGLKVLRSGESEDWLQRVHESGPVDRRRHIRKYPTTKSVNSRQRRHVLLNQSKQVT